MSGDLQTLLDRAAIQDLIFRYADAVTRADYDQMATVFASDAVWESPLLELHFESAAAFIDYQLAGSTALEVLIQTPHSPVIELIDSESATATTTTLEMFRGTTTNDQYGEVGAEINIQQYGIYYDDVAKIGADWKFTHRLFVPFFISPGAIVGDVVIPRPLRRAT